MTEPSAGSDLQRIRTTAERDGFSWVINGSKTFITDGINADIIVACRAGEVGSRGLSLIVVETGTRASHAARTWTSSACTLRTPASCSSTTSGTRGNPLGREGGVRHLMEELPLGRLSAAVSRSLRRARRSTGRSRIPGNAPRSAP
jgi:alkylation response protein AidB-like acyl-CoA dehydrogenase